MTKEDKDKTHQMMIPQASTFRAHFLVTLVGLICIDILG